MPVVKDNLHLNGGVRIEEKSYDGPPQQAPESGVRMALKIYNELGEIMKNISTLQGECIVCSAASAKQIADLERQLKEGQEKLEEAKALIGRLPSGHIKRKRWKTVEKLQKDFLNVEKDNKRLEDSGALRPATE